MPAAVPTPAPETATVKSATAAAMKSTAKTTAVVSTPEGTTTSKATAKGAAAPEPAKPSPKRRGRTARRSATPAAIATSRRHAVTGRCIRIRARGISRRCPTAARRNRTWITTVCTRRRWSCAGTCGAPVAVVLPRPRARRCCGRAIAAGCSSPALCRCRGAPVILTPNARCVGSPRRNRLVGASRSKSTALRVSHTAASRRKRTALGSSPPPTRSGVSRSRYGSGPA